MVQFLRLLIPVAYVSLPTLYRARRAERIVRGNTDRHWVGFTEVLLNDVVLLAVLLALLAVAAHVRRRRLAGVVFGVAAVLQGVLVLDAVVLREFAQRLNLADMVRYGSYLPAYLLDYRPTFIAVLAVAAVVWSVAHYGLWRLVRWRRSGLQSTAFVLALLAVTSAAGWHSRDTGYVHSHFYQNLLSYNRTVLTEFKPYSRAFASELSDPFGEVCTHGPALDGPVIVYMVESLSSYQSALFGGLHDWTPRLDAIASEYSALVNFYANGFTTEDGELSLITGAYPLYSPNSFSDGGGTTFSGYWAPEQSIAAAFDAAGFRTLFLTTADLDFSRTGDWAHAVGFGHVEGSEAAFYEGWPRFHYDAAPDEALVDRILEVTGGSDDDALIFVKTASSHHPHVDPRTGVRSEERVVRYVDEQIGRLYDRLKADGYFERGHLIIVGDHRAMIPFRSDEVDRFGFERAHARVPAVLVSDQLAPEPETIGEPFSQVDIANTLIGLASGRTCTSAVKGAIWGPGRRAPDYILHRRGDVRNQVSVFADDRLGTVTLNGDDTSFEGAGFDAAAQAAIVQYINHARVVAARADSGGGP